MVIFTIEACVDEGGASGVAGAGWGAMMGWRPISDEAARQMYASGRADRAARLLARLWGLVFALGLAIALTSKPARALQTYLYSPLQAAWSAWTAARNRAA